MNGTMPWQPAEWQESLSLTCCVYFLSHLTSAHMMMHAHADVRRTYMV